LESGLSVLLSESRIGKPAISLAVLALAGTDDAPSVISAAMTKSPRRLILTRPMRVLPLYLI
jgi:hypothetical protein